MIPTHCTKCDICLINNYHPLEGDGNNDANILFITRNPTSFDVKNNVPMISKDGMLFQEYLDMFNFNRDLIYITNAVKCRTPGNRYPTDKEIYNCRGYLDLEISKINPKIIVLLGLTAVKSYFKLAFSTINLNMDMLNSKYIVSNGRIILFMVHPVHGLNSISGRIKLYNAFLSLLRLYYIINPAHKISIRI
jgi:uracil-DNA glycosylase family 4